MIILALIINFAYFNIVDLITYPYYFDLRAKGWYMIKVIRRLKEQQITGYFTQELTK